MKILYLFKQYFFITIIAITFITTNATAITLETKGRAIINNNIDRARDLAYQDALRQAAISSGVEVYSQSSHSIYGEMTDSMQLRSYQKVTSASIIDEEILDDMIIVTIRAEVQDSQKSCNFTSSQYRKRIAATFFPMLHPEHMQVSDFFNIDKGISTVILRRLYNTGIFLTREANNINLYNDLNLAPYISQEEISDDTLLTRFANRHNIQYVISGIIRDLSTETEGTTLHKYLPFLPNMASFNGTARQIESRNIIIDFFLHDALTGELLSQHTYSKTVKGSDVVPEHATAFGTRAFFKTKFGQEFSKIIDQEALRIKNILSCRPFTMKVIDQKNGKLYLDAGFNSNIKVDDVLTVYVPDQPGETFDVKGYTSQFGSPKTMIRVDKVYPAYSTAIPESGTFTKQDIINGYLIAW